MTEILCITLAAVLVLLGFIGCFLPVLPGPVLAYCGLLAMLPCKFAPSATACAAFGVACALVTVLDYVVPAYGAKKFNCSRAGVWGCMAGTFFGLFLAPWGIIFGPFIGAVAGELCAGKHIRQAMAGGFGAFLGFLCGTFVKIVYCGACIAWCAVQIFR